MLFKYFLSTVLSADFEEYFILDLINSFNLVDLTEAAQTIFKNICLFLPGSTYFLIFPGGFMFHQIYIFIFSTFLPPHRHLLIFDMNILERKEVDRGRPSVQLREYGTKSSQSAHVAVACLFGR